MSKEQSARPDGYASLIEVNSYDQAFNGTCFAAINDVFDMARDTSMDVTNDPRFFTNTVMSKRLAAFKSLTIVSSLMFGTALAQCFGMKKDLDFSKYDPVLGPWFLGNIGVWEFAAFILSCVVVGMCLLPLYVLAHQLFYCTRLMTAGPTGFEQASMFYLTRIIVVWRHLAISCLFNGLWVFMILIGIQYFILFYKDANGMVHKPHEIYVTNMLAGTSYNASHLPKFQSHHKLSMELHSACAWFAFALMFIVTCGLWRVRVNHMSVFKAHYAQATLRSAPLQHSLNEMGHRAGVPAS